MESAEALFNGLRRRLTGLAYRMLGSATEAEDVVQDAFLRWHQADRSAIDVPAAWLTKAVTNLCLNRMTSARATREQYIGSWLPEPVHTAGGALGPLDTAEQRDSVSMGVLVMLERLTPAERAVFVLREAFGYRHREIAGILDADEAHCRQLLRRARRNLAEDRRRFPADRSQQDRLVRGFLTATLSGDLPALERLLADDVISWSDGGGAINAARRPVLGRAKVLRYLIGMYGRPEAAAVTTEIAEVNGQPAGVLRIDGRLLAVWLPEVDGDRIIGLRLVVNPAKLTYLAHQLT